MSKIRSAFVDVVLGDGTGLWEAQAIDDYQTAEVQQEYRQKDEKADWEKLSVDDLQRCHSSLCFFDADGMRFHIPAYIAASLANKVDEPTFNLTLLDDYNRSQFASLNRAQKHAIASYLKWCLEQAEYEFDHPTISHALNEYWES